MVYPLSADFCIAMFRKNSESFLRTSGWREISCFGGGPYVTFNFMNNNDNRVAVDITRKISAQEESMRHVCQILQLAKNMIEMKGSREGRIVRKNKIEILWEKSPWGTTLSIKYGHPNEYQCDYDLHILWRT